MWWLWIAGPLAVLFVYAVTAQVNQRRTLEVDEWAKSTGVKAVNAAPSDIAGMFEEAGGGAPVRIFELYPKLAYLGVFEANAVAGSDHQTVVCKLEAAAPQMTSRPLPVVEGNRIANDGVPFPKHAAFAELFLVEGPSHSAIKKWLGRPLRKALLNLPDGWLRVEGKVMALTLYGAADFDLVDELCATADTLFAEYGAEGGPSLLPELEDRDDEADAGDQDDEDEDEPAPPPKKVAAKPSPAPKPSPAALVGSAKVAASKATASKSPGKSKKA